MTRFARLYATLAILVSSIPALAAEPLPTIERINKKLIEYGWDVPTPDFIRANIREMEKLPFEGLIFRLKAGDNVLDPAPYDEGKYAEDFDNASYARINSRNWPGAIQSMRTKENDRIGYFAYATIDPQGRVFGQNPVEEIQS